MFRFCGDIIMKGLMDMVSLVLMVVEDIKWIGLFFIVVKVGFVVGLVVVVDWLFYDWWIGLLFMLFLILFVGVLGFCNYVVLDLCCVWIGVVIFVFGVLFVIEEFNILLCLIFVVLLIIVLMFMMNVDVIGLVD